MGSLRDHKLNDYIKKYNLKYYFETGTGVGDCLSYALNYDFDEYYTVDIDEDLVSKTYATLKRVNKNINFLIGKSTDILDEYLDQIPKESPILFYLDAHFPGADFHKCTYEESIREHKIDAFPLEEEIDIIISKRDCSKDVFIIDDLVLYEPGDYTWVLAGNNYEYGWLQEELGIKTDSSFLYEKLEKTHNFEKDLRHQGYLIITPKEK